MSGTATALHATLDLGHSVHILRVELEEALDLPYTARVDIEVDAPDVALDELLGRDIVVSFERAPLERRVCGLIRSLRKVASVQERSCFRLDVAPAMAMLALRRNTRMFQEKTAPEILEAVLSEALGPYGREVKLELEGEYPAREYCLQYQESDLDFVHRLCEEEGITYCFDHADAVEVLLLRDRNASHPPLEGIEPALTYRPYNAAAHEADGIYEFVREHRTETTAIAIRDFDWTSPAQAIEATGGGDDSLGRTRESYEHGWGRGVTISSYDAGPRRYGEQDADRRAALRLEAEVAPLLEGQGTSNVVALVPGRTFELGSHPLAGIDGSYLVTRVVHSSHFEAEGEGETASGYRNRFQCVPVDVEHRPRRRTPKPAIGGIQTAIVTGPSGEEIHTDEHGRVKVQFHWDRENPADETSSCWVRVQQKWAGAGWGFWWLPRIGMEVIVQFIDGDPDRPLATGAVYDAAHPTPYALPDEKTKSTIKSNSSPGGGGSNELRFEDKAGSEEIYSHAQKDYDEVVLNDHTTHVHHDQTNTVDNDQTQTIHNNQTEDVGADQTMTVDGNRTVHVEGNYDESVDGTETRKVAGDVSETFSANETRSVGASLTEDISASETRTIGGNQTETIGATEARTVAAASSVTITGTLSETVVGGVTLDTPATWDVTATGGLNIVAAGGVKIDGAGGWKVSAAGGVNQVDSKRDWWGNLKKESGSLINGKWWSKFETYVLQASYTHSKCGFTGADFPQLGFSLEGRTGEFGNTLFKLECCAVTLRDDGASAED